MSGWEVEGTAVIRVGKPGLPDVLQQKARTTDSENYWDFPRCPTSGITKKTKKLENTFRKLDLSPPSPKDGDILY
jgi:hypothetical protein